MTTQPKIPFVSDAPPEERIDLQVLLHDLRSDLQVLRESCANLGLYCSDGSLGIDDGSTAIIFGKGLTNGEWESLQILNSEHQIPF